MSMYEIMFPDENREKRVALLTELYWDSPLPPKMFRLRDAWFETFEDQPVLRVLTRLGGGNRTDYEHEIALLRKNPMFYKDEDEDEWDKTYASFYFKIPASAVSSVQEAILPFHANMKEMMQAAMKKMEDEGLHPSQVAFMDQFKAMLDDPDADGTMYV